MTKKEFIEDENIIIIDTNNKLFKNCDLRNF